MPNLSNLLIPAVLFFALGFLARVVRSDLRFPPDLAKLLSIYLLVSIGIHGGYELGRADLLTGLYAVFWAIVIITRHRRDFSVCALRHKGVGDSIQPRIAHSSHDP